MRRPRDDRSETWGPLSRREWLYVLLAVAGAYALVPYRIYWSDHHLMIPFLAEYIDSTRFPGDPAMDMAGQYTVLAFYFQAPVVWALGLELGYFVMHLLAMIGTFAAVAALARRFSESVWAPPIALAMFAVQKYLLGGVYTYDRSLLSRHLAYPLILWGLWSVLERRPYRSAVLLGLGLVMHPVIGLSGVFAAGLLVAADLGAWRSWHTAGAAALGAGFASLVLAARASTGGPSTLVTVDPQWLDLIAITNSGHFFVSAYGPGFLQANAAVALAIALSAFYLRARRHAVAVLLLALSVMLSAVFNFIFTEIQPVQLIMLASPMRITRIAVTVGIASLAAAMVELWERERAARWLVAGIGAAIAIEYRMRPLRLFVYVWLGWEILSALLPRLLGRIPNALWAAAPVAGFLWVSKWYPPGSSRFIEVAIVSVAAVAVVFASSRWRTPRSLVAVLVAALVALAVFRFPTGDTLAGDLPFVRHDAYTEVGLWAKEHTPSHALFITDNRSGFRAFAMRGTIGNFHDGTYANLSREYAFAWRDRLRALCRVENIRDPCAFETHDTESFRALARASGATHLLVRADHAALDFPLLFQNAGYRIHAIEP